MSCRDSAAGGEVRQGNGGDDRGIALMMVLWLLVLMSIISLNFLMSTRWGTAGVRNYKEETQAHYLALSGYQEALNYLASDKDPAVDFMDSEGTFRIDSETAPVTGKRVSSDGEVEILITDENARININYANQDRLTRLLSYCGVGFDDMNVIIDSLMDWKDLDDEHHLSGAESEYYEALADPYAAKNGLFDVPEELALVKGMKREYVRGDAEGVRSVIPLITTFGRNIMNINTVSREVMEVLGLNEVEIETILKQRSKDFGGFRFIPQQFSARGLNAIATQNFRIEVRARMTNSSVVSRVTGVLYRQPSADGFKFRTLYWKENAETIRA